MKITKILVALSFLFSVATANAGEMTVTGAIKATYQSEREGANSTTGNPFGMDRELAFTGSTELDNGVSVTYLVDTTDTFGFGDSELTFGNVFGLGTIRIGSDFDPMDAVDDITPTAFEEANGGGAGTYAGDIGSLVNTGTHIGGAIAIPYLGTLNANYYPKTDGVENADGAASGNSTSLNHAVGSGYSATLTTQMNALPVVGGLLDNLVLTTGIEERETGTVAKTADALGLTAALNYAYGPIKFGYQKKFSDGGQTTSATADQTTYKDDIIGIAYAVNDSLSLSWNRYSSTKSTDAANEVEQETDAISIGYTVGGMTFGFQDAQTDNAAYTLNAKDDTRRIQLTVAF